MKLHINSGSQASRNGSSVIVVLLLVAILFLYLNATLKTLHTLGRHIRLVEKHQVMHWQQFKPESQADLNSTNTIAATTWTASQPSTNH